MKITAEDMIPIHQSVLQVIEMLIDLNPAEGSPECNLLSALGAAVDEYERTEFPLPT